MRRTREAEEGGSTVLLSKVAAAPSPLVCVATRPASAQDASPSSSSGYAMLVREQVARCWYGDERGDLPAGRQGRKCRRIAGGWRQRRAAALGLCCGTLRKVVAEVRAAVALGRDEPPRKEEEEEGRGRSKIEIRRWARR